MSGEGTTVLVVDDEASIRLLCRVNLELEGYRVLEAASLDAAREALEAEEVGILLIDVHLGDRDGRELVRSLREAGSGVRVALLTGTVDLDADSRVGVDAVIEKPFALQELLETVARLDGPRS